MDGDVMSDAIQEIKRLRAEAQREWAEWMQEAETDSRYYLGDQWDGADAAKLEREGRPKLSINKIKKQCDIITGYEKSNRTQLRVQPVEGADQPMSDVYSEAIAWVLGDRNGAHAVSLAFESAIKLGIGWIHPIMSYDDDLINGDIIIRAENPFRILPDPYFTEADLSDCDYILRLGWLSKGKAANLYPEHAKEIEKIQAGSGAQFDVQNPAYRIANKTHVNITERWYRDYEKQNYVIEGTTVRAIDDESARGFKELAAASPEEFGHLVVIERKVPIIKMQSVIEDQILCYDGPSPYYQRMYPFIPVFGDYDPSFNDWKWKLQGRVRLLRDSQNEANKRRSQLLHAAMTIPLSGWYYEEGAVDDPKVFNESAGAGKAMKIRDINKVKQIVPQNIPAGLVQLEKMHDEDMIRMNLNADLLGAIEGGTGASAPGITLQLRQRQGLIAVQGLFENLSNAKKILGKYLVEMINERWDRTKLERIIGRELPMDWDDVKQDARYDVVIDEIINSPTYRMTNFVILTQLAQSGFPVSPQTIVKYSDFPQGMKDDIMNDIQQAQQAQQPQGPPPTPETPNIADAPMDVPPELMA